MSNRPEMPDPLTQLVGLLQPEAGFSKLVLASGSWSVRRSEDGRPFYCAALEGSCRLAVIGQEPIIVQKGDFVLIPAADDFTSSSVEPPPPGHLTRHREVAPGVFQLGEPDAIPDARLLVGHCSFKSHDANLLVSFLPSVLHIRDQNRLTKLVELVNEESRHQRPGRAAILARLLEVLLIEACRSTATPSAAPGLLRGLADDRLAAALRLMHGDPKRALTVTALAKEAAMSRSDFFDRFKREVGAPPMEYLLAWRMALAKDRLARSKVRIAQLAEDIGYRSASTFSAAFTRHVGASPAQYAREQQTSGAFDHTDTMAVHVHA